MTNPAPQPDMAWHLRRLLEAVKEAACGLEGRLRWLTGPLALLTWLRTRRERREAAEAMQAVQGLLEAFLGLLEDFRVGRLATEANETATGRDGAVAPPPPLPSPVKGEGEEAPTPAQSPIEGEGEGALACEIQRPARNVSPPRFSAPSAVVPAALTVQFPGMTGTGVLAARLGSGVRRNDEQNQRLARTLWPPQLAPPEGGFQKLGREWWGFARALCYDIVMIFAGAIPLELHPTSRARSAPARRRGRALWRRR